MRSSAAQSTLIRSGYFEKLTIQWLADQVRVDRTYLYRLFKEEVGICPKEYLTQYRIRMATVMLSTTNQSIKGDQLRLRLYRHLPFLYLL